MASNELLPLFPSATHPAIPISAQILSTLRHLTGPGKGNDLKPEERAALVGVSALLGCEKIQSKDLPLSSAQKASSVSPANFRSALSRCRILLESIPSSPITSPSLASSSKRSNNVGGRSPSKRSSTSSTSTSTSNINIDNNNNNHNEIEDGRGITPSIRAEDILSPLQTPKKKYKFSSGIDISSLISSSPNKTPRKYDSVIASPLRQSITRQPSTKYPPQPPSQSVLLDDQEDTTENEQGKRGGEDGGTPSKKVKYLKGVDLENPPNSIKSVESQRKKKNENSSAFFALRPSNSLSTPTATKRHAMQTQDEGGGGGEEEQNWMHRRPQETHSQSKKPHLSDIKRRKRQKKKENSKIDWTYSETVWDKDVEKGEQELNKIWENLDIWLERNDMPSIYDTEVKGKDLTEILINSLVRPINAKAGR
ncbi:uncharacterized protein L201_003415 [Kwoniella dendrophila CBS 6074]|uniref:Uncharacterized protein n=1 Tax=Kwoniella dendrophila CBS 6074 TaxID=1295534 RepID=A0AAX4JU97_9TREE